MAVVWCFCFWCSCSVGGRDIIVVFFVVGRGFVVNGGVVGDFFVGFLLTLFFCCC